MCYVAGPQLRRTLWTGKLLAALSERQVLEWNDVVRHGGPDVTSGAGIQFPDF